MFGGGGPNPYRIAHSLEVQASADGVAAARIYGKKIVFAEAWTGTANPVPPPAQAISYC